MTSTCQPLANLPNRNSFAKGRLIYYLTSLAIYQPRYILVVSMIRPIIDMLHHQILTLHPCIQITLQDQTPPYLLHIIQLIKTIS